MRAIEPGETFDVTYGKGRKVTLAALSKRDDLKLAELESSSVQTMPEAYDLAEKMLRLFMPNATDEEFAELVGQCNLPMLKEILSKANATTHLSEEDEKKSE